MMWDKKETPASLKAKRKKRLAFVRELIHKTELEFLTSKTTLEKMENNLLIQQKKVDFLLERLRFLRQEREDLLKEKVE